MTEIMKSIIVIFFFKFLFITFFVYLNFYQIIKCIKLVSLEVEFNFKCKPFPFFNS